MISSLILLSLLNNFRQYKTAFGGAGEDYTMCWEKVREIVLVHLKCYPRDIVRSNKNVTEGTMSEDEKMSINERRKYLGLIQKRYIKASKVERTQLLDEMEAVTDLHRKSLIRLMASDMKRTPRQRHRGRQYGPEVDDALRVISESVDHICAERLQPNLEWLAQHLARHGEMEVSEPLMVQLRKISVSTVKRILKRICGHRVERTDGYLGTQLPGHASSLQSDLEPLTISCIRNTS
jgi:hypothetical protein